MRNTSPHSSRFLTAPRALRVASLSSGTLVWALLGAAAWVVAPTAHAQVQASDNTTGLTVRVERGGRVTLPIANVARVLPEDVDVVRASFADNRALLEGVSLGTTQIEVLGMDGRVQIVRVEVVQPGTLGALAPVRPATEVVPVAATVEATAPETAAPEIASPPPKLPHPLWLRRWAEPPLSPLHRTRCRCAWRPSKIIRSRLW